MVYVLVKHLQQRSDSSWRYRRRLPKDVSEASGKSEFVLAVGKTKEEAMRRYANADKAFEQFVSTWRRNSPAATDKDRNTPATEARALSPKQLPG